MVQTDPIMQALLVTDAALRATFPLDFHKRCMYASFAIASLLDDAGLEAEVAGGDFLCAVVSTDGRQLSLQGFGTSGVGEPSHYWVHANGLHIDPGPTYLPYESPYPAPALPAVAWPSASPLPVALNAQRAAEEASRQVRWLRPEYQAPTRGTPEQARLAADIAESDNSREVMSPAFQAIAWPKNPIDQVRAVANVVSSTLAPLASEDVAARFTGRGPWKRRLEHVLEMLVAVGQAVETDGRYTQV